VLSLKETVCSTHPISAGAFHSCITPEAWGRFYWTMVSINTLVSMGDGLGGPGRRLETNTKVQ
jgi:hypothetical protein